MPLLPATLSKVSSLYIHTSSPSFCDDALQPGWEKRSGGGSEVWAGRYQPRWFVGRVCGWVVRLRFAVCPSFGVPPRALGERLFCGTTVVARLGAYGAHEYLEPRGIEQ